MSARAILDLYDAGHRTQAIELARCLGGEAERLVLAMHRAGEIIDEIYNVRDRVESMWAACAETGKPAHLSFEHQQSLICLLIDGVDYWDDQWFSLYRQLSALEAA